MARRGVVNGDGRGFGIRPTACGGVAKRKGRGLATKRRAQVMGAWPGRLGAWL